MLIQGSGKVFLPMITEVISLSKLENSKLDMRPKSQTGMKRVNKWMDSMIAALIHQVASQLVCPLCT